MDNFTRDVNNAISYIAEAFRKLAEHVTEVFESLTPMIEAARDKHAPPAYVALTRPRPHRVRARDKVLDRRPVVSHRLNH